MDIKLYQMLLETFAVELQELQQSFITGLLSLEKATSSEVIEDALQQLFRYAHNMKGAAASAAVTPIATIAHRLEDLFSEWQNNYDLINKEQITACLDVIDNLPHAFQSYCHHESVDVDRYLDLLSGKKVVLSEVDETIKDEFIKLPISRVERASAKANEFITYQLKLTNWIKDIDAILREMTQGRGEHINLPLLEKKMINIATAGGQFLGEFTRSVHALQSELKGMRMRPVSTVLLPLARTVRNVAMTLDKSVELHIDGGDTELDKSILDAIKDPLQHLVRNAIDHGIETDVERQKLKKPLPAILQIRIEQVSGKIKLSLRDDGQGIDVKKVKNHALSMGLYAEEKLAELDDEQSLNLIFQPGFSMQENITEISGRGIGLDVVKNNIQNMKGSISLETKVGYGSCFTLMLPLTLATTRGVFFKINDQLFMLPTLSLSALFEISLLDVASVDNQSIWVVDNKPIPIQLLSEVLNIDNKLHVGHNFYGLLIEHQSQQMIFLVDSIIDEHDCVVGSLPFPYTQLPQFIGVTLTGNSELALVLDPLKLLEIAMSNGVSDVHELHPAKDETTILKKRILVVDDSLTTRTLCANAVEAAGYHVVSMVDGKKAWEFLKKEPVDCVITDIMMPEMDGFELTTKIKRNKRYTHIPVIIVSLLDSKESKQRGLEAGANAFIVKSEFDTHSLIEMMESFL